MLYPWVDTRHNENIHAWWFKGLIWGRGHALFVLLIHKRGAGGQEGVYPHSALLTGAFAWAKLEKPREQSRLDQSGFETLGLHKGAGGVGKRKGGNENLFGFCGVWRGNLQASALTDAGTFLVLGLWERKCVVLDFGSVGALYSSILGCVYI